MDTYFERKHSCLGVDFCHTRKPVVDEREIHSYHEILYYVDGDATLICEDFSKKLSRGSLILIPKESYHFFRCGEPRKFERMKISFSSLVGFDGFISPIMTKIRIFDALDPGCADILNKMCDCLREEGNEDRSAFLYGSLLTLLSLLDIKSDRPREDKERDRLVSAALRYIEANLMKALDTETVARSMNVSSSSLSHIFKHEMGISLHKYVTEKRMVLAKKLIEGGKNPTKIYAECGYGDYSSFYKAYVKLFGHAPSKSDETSL